VDLRWHAANRRRFERASDQFGAHWLIWLGVLVLLIVAVVGASRVPSRWYVGFRLLLLAVACHVLVDGWHFWEHYNLRDPVIPWHGAMACRWWSWWVAGSPPRLARRP
jgi:hypothetical protein